MKQEYDVIVVGGGPAGTMAAWEVAKEGYSVCILDKKRDIGSPVRCGEAIGFTGLNQFIKPRKSWISTTIKSVNLVSPNKKNIVINFSKETGYILNRKIFDHDLSNLATKSGVEVFTKSYVKGLIYEKGYFCGVNVDCMGKTKKIKSKIIIGADGIETRVGRWAGIRTNVKMKDMESCYQYTLSNVKVDSSQMIMYVGEKYAPGGYLWIFPKNDGMANIGIGISGKYSKYKSAKAYLDEFVKANYPKSSVLTSVSGGVICSKPIDKPIANGLILVGDAAHQINPMTGGGIASGMRGGQIGGQIVVESLKRKDYSKLFLAKYPKLMFKVFGKNHNRFYKIKESVNQLSDQDLNSIADSIEKIPVDKRTLITVFKKAVFKKPRLLFDVLKVFAGV